MIFLLAIIGVLFLIWYVSRGLRRAGDAIYKWGDSVLDTVSSRPVLRNKSVKKEEVSDEYMLKVQKEIESLTENKSDLSS